MFLGVEPSVTNWSSDQKEFSLVLDHNPLVDMVELPETHRDLWFSNILCGVIRGSLEMVGVRVPVCVMSLQCSPEGQSHYTHSIGSFPDHLLVQ